MSFSHLVEKVKYNETAGTQKMKSHIVYYQRHGEQLGETIAQVDLAWGHRVLVLQSQNFVLLNVLLWLSTPPGLRN